MNRISRRAFLGRGLAAGVAGGATLALGKKAFAAGPAVSPRGSVIDLTRRDGCPDDQVPRCVSACRTKNAARFPVVQQPIQPYWPQTKYEDWSDKRGVTNRLTPYNWTYVQQVNLGQGQQHRVSVPRRCVHCDNPPCVSICPFAAQTKQPEGP